MGLEGTAEEEVVVVVVEEEDVSVVAVLDVQCECSLRNEVI